ncbi:hypothetical protein RHMOL_Rhmol10G0287200 [Rhododendron molle]|uniref:Uncharacterized protein n=1 Tax=Rhododendron molle TaxID=49168 RepID=A0ACC0M713_RHOML|nr:hypothetical protein RHMOL_Rhmol10G0287200 [Rhododendron molle]
MATSFRRNPLSSRIKALLTPLRLDRTLAESWAQTQFHASMGSASALERGKVDMSNWRKLDSRILGLTQSMISSSSLIVLKILQGAGFDAYLVGGCVRDLLLNKVPKDFDVVTTATLKQIKKEFYRCLIVGQRFPICHVHVRGSVVEVSSFETAAKNGKEKQKTIFSQMPPGCDKKDFVRWRDSMRRDFTINSLFFDPFVNKIYDYTGGMMDLRTLKLQTLIPAQLSFKEDCARILRGLRIAARLGLSLSKETEIAIHKLSSSIAKLSKTRIMLELNYMLSYGAAEPSLCLLQRFNLLDILLPFHAAYLAQHDSNHSCQSSMMLMKLFFNLDKLVTCDRPSDCRLWVGLLAFHLALVNHPQDALAVWTFASVLYHGTWKEGVKFAIEHAQALTSFIPEISEVHHNRTEDELAQRVTQLASLVQDSIGALTETDNLVDKMSRFPDFPCSDVVFVPYKTAKDTARLFSVLVHDVEHYDSGRNSFNIDYELLRKGDEQETRFVLGRIVMDTMSSGVVQESKFVEVEEKHKDWALTGGKCDIAPPCVQTRHNVGKEDRKHSLSLANAYLRQDRVVKRHKLIDEKCNLSENGIVKMKNSVATVELKKKYKQKPEMIEESEFPQVAKKHEKIVKKESRCTSLKEITQKQQNMGNLLSEEIDQNQLPPDSIKQRDVVSKKKKFHFLSEEGFTEENGRHKQDLAKKKPKSLVLSRLFR